MKNITVIKRISFGVVALLCIWGSFSATRMVTNSRANAATSADVMERSSLLSILQQRRYVGGLYERVSNHPEQIKQLADSDFRKMFKEPELQRREGRLTVWQYRSERCVLDLYFKDKKTKPVDYIVRERHTAYFTHADAESESLSEAECLQTIVSM